MPHGQDKFTKFRTSFHDEGIGNGMHQERILRNEASKSDLKGDSEFLQVGRTPREDELALIESLARKQASLDQNQRAGKAS